MTPIEAPRQRVLDSWRMPRREGGDGILFVGNYLPRACGIATFTYDLAESVARATSRPVEVVAMNDRREGYRYPERVTLAIQQNRHIDYALAAEYINNNSAIGTVCLQHEFGIFGGVWGSHILTLLRGLRKPLVVTCHTVPAHPQAEQQRVLQDIGALAQKVVVMHQHAVGLLSKLYGVPRDKVAYIRHGIHDMPFAHPQRVATDAPRGWRLLTFGLLHRNKGIEYMIEAMPAILDHHPNTLYYVVGATHPNVRKCEGEAYRYQLAERVRELGIERQVLFVDAFLDLNQLLDYLGTTDVFVAPYADLDQVTSGALSYAAGAGTAVVATPFLHAKELLADERGVFVPPHNSVALAETIVRLLGDDIALHAMRRRIYDHCRSMIWPATARAYTKLFDETSQPIGRGRALAAPRAPHRRASGVRSGRHGA